MFHTTKAGVKVHLGVQRWVPSIFHRYELAGNGAFSVPLLH